MSQDIITVTSPLLPPLEEFKPYLEDIWRRKWLQTMAIITKSWKMLSVNI